MTKTTITFEIHNITTDEILVENASFDDIPELVYEYQRMLPIHEIVACYREITITERVHELPKDEFKHDWFELLDDIVDNLYHP